MNLSDLARAWLQRLGWPAALLPVYLRVLTLCDDIGQLLRGPGTDFCAYLRCEFDGLPLVRAEAVDAVLAQPREILTGGPVLYAIAFMADDRAWALRTALSLRRLPGVTYIAADRLRWQHRWKDSWRMKRNTLCLG